jgi:hypothetical protein
VRRSAVVSAHLEGMSTSSREADHPRTTTGKFTTNVHEKERIAPAGMAHDPISEAKVPLFRAVTGTDIVRVQTLAEFDGSTRVMVTNQEVLTVRHAAPRSSAPLCATPVNPPIDALTGGDLTCSGVVS